MFNLSESEITKFQKMLEAEIAKLAVIKKNPVTQGTPSKEGEFGKVVTIAQLRADEVKPSLTKAEVFKNAPSHNGEYFLVPQVREE